ncbi:MAG TPA: DNA-formamidopyrimidine glycosylase family protein [Acidobacteriota bacterium]|nr:DNA-formamidopyrimidine glycosylase family protein [Acidobacteriota bacterium]
MPEGDTIYRTAVTLTRVLAGKTIQKCESFVADIQPQYLEGKKITRVESRGKNLLIHFSNGYVLHTHMRMSGSWHIYRIGERWRKSRNSARVAIQVEDFVAVCFNVPVVRLFTSGGIQRDQHLSQLGPDALKPDQWDPVSIRERFRKHPHLEIGVALLRQDLFAGIGNIYKNEALFAERISPFELVSSLSDKALEQLIARASSLMSRSAHSERRDSYWVYSRSGKPCRVCGQVICMQRQGQQQRSSYYCPECQKPLKQPDVPYPHEIGTGP